MNQGKAEGMKSHRISQYAPCYGVFVNIYRHWRRGNKKATTPRYGVPKHSESEPNREQRRILSQLGENIRRERRRKGLTQEELAERAGLHPRVLQKMESAQSNILATTLCRIQAALECPWDLLMSNLNATESVEGWLKRMTESDDPDWRVFMQKVRSSWEAREKPSPGKISLR